MQRKCTFYSSRVVGCVYPGRFHLLIYPRLLISRRYANDKRGFFLDYRERARHRLEYRRKKWCHRSGTPCIFSYITPIDTRASHSYPSVSFSFLFIFFFSLVAVWEKFDFCETTCESTVIYVDIIGCMLDYY